MIWHLMPWRRLLLKEDNQPINHDDKLQISPYSPPALCNFFRENVEKQRNELFCS